MSKKFMGYTEPENFFLFFVVGGGGGGVGVRGCGIDSLAFMVSVLFSRIKLSGFEPAPRGHSVVPLDKTSYITLRAPLDLFPPKCIDGCWRT